jgi:hypothetical protein
MAIDCIIPPERASVGLLTERHEAKSFRAGFGKDAVVI